MQNSQTISSTTEHQMISKASIGFEKESSKNNYNGKADGLNVTEREEEEEDEDEDQARMIKNNRSVS